MAASSYERRRRRRRKLIALAVLVLLAAGGWLAFQRLMRPAVTTFASEVDHFKYGSIGNDAPTGIPYPIWAVLPEVFPEYLPGPGGYASVGFRWEPGRTRLDTPLGFSRVRVGVDRMAINCSLCHITSYRLAPEAPLQFALGGVSNALDVLAYQRFLAASARDARFNADVLLPAMARLGIELNWLERQLYRYALIPATRRALLDQAADFAWTGDRPSWGPGRVDPFNPAKFSYLEMPVDDSIGNSDMQAVWGLDARERMRPGGFFHWDGLSNSVREVVHSSALGDGADAGTYSSWRPSMDRIENFLRRLQPPPSPWRPDANAVGRGRALFEAQCSACHGPQGPRTLTIIPWREVGTDPNRLFMWTPRSAATYTAYGHDDGFDFRAFHHFDGYIAETLDGLWLRGPYLHNGSVPTLADLLEPPERRPAAFVRGGETLDPVRGGFIAPACDPARPVRGRFCFDTGAPGNSNRGHLWGTALAAGQKADLLAYLLTL